MIDKPRSLTHASRRYIGNTKYSVFYLFIYLFFKIAKALCSNVVHLRFTF